MSTTLTIIDQRLKDSVAHQLEWDPALDASMVGVTAQDGVVTLTGYVDTYAAKLAAERSARHVFGVKAVANKLEVKLASERIDPDIAKDALDALKNRIDVPLGVSVTVRDGFITLGGTVEWMYQKMGAERAVKYLRGVRGVFNQIALKPSVSPKDVQKRITDALHRHADIDARRIHVEAEGAKVILSGTVRSWIEKDEAQRAAWAAPGVITVDNRIAVVP
jgi:osmotically-inducible protein OsmY